MQSPKNYILTIHNPESVVDVYINDAYNQITELKQLNGNRTKRYDYPLDRYLSTVRNFKGVDTRIKQFIQAGK